MRKLHFKSRRHVYQNRYGRTEEIYECESCEGCPHTSDCCPKATNKRTIRINEELTSIYQEVISNLESIHGALLRINRSIQAEGTFGVLKWDKSYKRLIRRGEKNVILELTLISCGFNLYKYHNKKQRKGLAA
ncbi:transposase [Enterocloster aldenensis]